MTDRTLTRQTLSVTLCLALILVTMGSGADAAMLFQVQEATSVPAPSSGYQAKGRPKPLKSCKPWWHPSPYIRMRWWPRF